MKQALVVGGEASFVQDKITQNLQTLDIEVAHHWEWKKQPPDTIPAGTQLVLLLYEMGSHSLFNKAKEAAQKEGIPAVNVSRKFVLLRKSLIDQGIINDPNDEDEEEEKAPEMDPAEKKRITKLYLAANPLATNGEVQHALLNEHGVSIHHSFLATARIDLGIKTGKGRGTPTVDEKIYKRACRDLGVEPVDLGAFFNPPPPPAPEPKPTPKPEPVVEMAPSGPWKPTEDFRAALIELRNQMKRNDIEHLSLGLDGTIEYRRKIIVVHTEEDIIEI